MTDRYRRPLRLFISYAHVDRNTVQKVYRFLRDKKIEVWLDDENLIAGQDWRTEIEKALYSSDAVIVCLSKISVAKEGFVQKEFKFALDKALEMPEGRIFLIPIRLEECEVPLSLNRYQWVDFFNKDGRRKLVRSLNRTASQIGLLDPFPAVSSNSQDNLLSRKRVSTVVAHEGGESNFQTHSTISPQNTVQEERHTFKKYFEARTSRVAGTFYSSNPTQLANFIDEEFNKVIQKVSKENVVGLLMPNAGATYCWNIAAKSIGQVRGIEYDAITVISQFTSPHPAPLYSSEHDAYSTPLGNVEIDSYLLRKLMNNLEIKLLSNDPEHSIELTLPLLQRALPQGLRILPIMMRDYSYNMVQSLGQAVAELLVKRKSLLVVSSCLSHFYDAYHAIEYDRNMLDAIVGFDPQNVLETEKTGRGFANGVGPIAATIYASKLLGAKQAIEVGYGHSGMITGDNSSVVGYGAVVFVR